MDALQEHGIPRDERLIARASPDEVGGESAMMELLSQGGNMTAVVCYNDSMAAGAFPS